MLTLINIFKLVNLLDLALLNVLFLKLKHLNNSKNYIFKNIILKIKNLFFLLVVSIIITKFLIKLIFYKFHILLKQILSKYVNLIKKIKKNFFKIIIKFLFRYSISWL